MTFAAILDAAVRCIDDAGFTATTMTAVAADAGVPIATVYQWFATKDDLVVALAERHIGDSTTELLGLAAQMRESLPDLGEMIETFVRATVLLNTDHARFHRDLFSQCPRLPEIVAMIDAVDEALEAEVRWHLKRLDLEGDDPALRASVIVQTVAGLAHTTALDADPGPARERAVAEICRIVRLYLEGV